MTTALIIGGSGMLANVAVTLAAGYDTVGVIGRSTAKLSKFTDVSNIVRVQADYTKLEEFEAAVAAFAQQYEPIDVMVSWIHSSSPRAPLIAAKYCAHDFYDITGQSGIHKNHPSYAREQALTGQQLRYHRVILGSMGDRWLTNQEISDGVCQAIQAKSDQYIVGEV